MASFLANNGGSPRRCEKHPGGENPPDHLFLDLFWMQVVEPYAISEPFSTAGKVNLNYQMLPFRNIRRAKSAGFATKLVFVTVSLETALDRNAKRERTVPEEIVREKAETIYTAFEIAAKEADHVEMVWND